MDNTGVTTSAETGTRPVILWFRRDLRLADNPALARAISSGCPVLCVYIHDDAYGGRTPGAASMWWLDKSLKALAVSLAERGSSLVLRRGDTEAELRRLIDETGATAVYINRLFEPAGFTRDSELATALLADGIKVIACNGTLLSEPGKVLNGSGGPYKVFTPFLRALLSLTEPAEPLAAPAVIARGPLPRSDALEDWGLHPTRPDWSKGFNWEPGENGASRALAGFLDTGLKDYSTGRDFPSRPACSRLSPHLHWGEIAPWHLVRAARAAAQAGKVPAGEADKFIAEIGWRDFSAHLLHHFPTLPVQAFRAEYEGFPWRDDGPGFETWTKGMTGYPIIDAGMRELWSTGWMHNRVRMVVASFLVKHLLIDWRQGEAWFWDTLVDADLASNAQNWQWVAGSGADAAPYFRIFNPVTQGEKFDAAGKYVRLWVPELARVPDKWLQAPWTAPPGVLLDARVRLGKDYPRPMVDHAMARARALDALKSISANRSQA